MFSSSGFWIHVVLLFWFVTFSRAIMVTSPGEGTIWSSTGDHTVAWIEVDTDPTTFAITLVQLGVFKQLLASDVDGTKGSITISATLPTGSGFQVNIVKSAQEVDTILAQSSQINITSSGASGSGSSSTSSPSPSTSSPSNGTPGTTSASPVPSPSHSPTSSSSNGPSSTGLASAGPGGAGSPTVPTAAASPTSNNSTDSGGTTSLISLQPTSSNAIMTFVTKRNVFFPVFMTIFWTLV